jgi:F-type H+-transporting ATPase subunit b
MFDFYLIQQMVVQLFNAALLAFVLSKVLYNPVKKFLHQRKETIRSSIAEAQAALEQAEDTRTFYEERRSGIEAERKEIIDSARKRAAELEDKILGDARKEAQALIERTQREIEKAKEDSQTELRRQIVEISTIIAERYVMEKMDEQTGNRLLDEAVVGLGDTTWLN